MSLHISDDVLIRGGPLSAYALSHTIFDHNRAGILCDDLNQADLLLRDHYLQVRNNTRKSLAALHH
jgi:hypothetical protein